VVAVSDLCEACREADASVEATMMNESGGGHVQICDDCWEKLESDRCHVCGDRITSDHSPVVYLPGAGPTFEVCSGCRRDIVFGDGVSFDE